MRRQEYNLVKFVIFPKLDLIIPHYFSAFLKSVPYSISGVVRVQHELSLDERRQLDRLRSNEINEEWNKNIAEQR